MLLLVQRGQFLCLTVQCGHYYICRRLISLINTSKSITWITGHYYHRFHLNLISTQGFSSECTKSDMTGIPFPYCSFENQLDTRIAALWRFYGNEHSGNVFLCNWSPIKLHVSLQVELQGFQTAVYIVFFVCLLLLLKTVWRLKHCPVKTYILSQST